MHDPQGRPCTSRKAGTRGWCQPQAGNGGSSLLGALLSLVLLTGVSIAVGVGIALNEERGLDLTAPLKGAKEKVASLLNHRLAPPKVALPIGPGAGSGNGASLEDLQEMLGSEGGEMDLSALEDLMDPEDLESLQGMLPSRHTQQSETAAPATNAAVAPASKYTADQLVGTWRFELEQEEGYTARFKGIFKPNGRFELLGDVTIGEHLRHFTAKGTWHMENDVVHYQNVQFMPAKFALKGRFMTDTVKQLTQDTLVFGSDDNTDFRGTRVRP